MSAILHRIVLSVFGAVLFGLGAAARDAAYVGGDFGATFLVEAGLLLPIAWTIGAVVGVALAVVDPSRAWSPVALLAWMRRDDGRGRRAAATFLAPAAACAWIVVMANVARRDLGAIDVSPRAVGAVMGGEGTALAMALFAIVAWIARRWGKRLETIDPALGLGAGVALAATVLAYGVASGSVGGQGGWLGIFGVLKRDELDLRAPSLLAIIALGAVLFHAAPRRFFAPLAAALAVAPVVLTVRAASALDAAPKLATEIERGAPLGKIALRLARHRTDRDHDGFSRTFGGGDCDDRDPNVNPAALDVPGNGMDEDCSGADAVPIAETPRPAPTTPAEPSVKAPEGLSVLLVTVDTLRADLHYAGYPREVSPNLDAFAKESVVFDDAVSLASYTGKSVGPLLSGKYPSETHRGWSHFNTFTKDDVMVAERMKEAGLATLSVQAHWYFERFSGLGRGFDVLDTSAMPPVGLQQDNDATTTSDKLTDAAIKRLSDPEITGKRFFAWVHYLDPHADYLHHEGVPDFAKDGQTLDGRGPIRAPYDNEVAFTDQQIGRLFESLRKQPYFDKLAIVVTSDHGEAFGEHKLLRHGFEVWEELVRVPLLIRVPGAPPHHVTARRSAIDLVPTLLDLAGVTPKLGTTPSDFLSGVSLLPDVMDGKDWVPEERDVLVDMPAGPNNDERRAFYHGNWKLYVTGGYAYQLFDLEKDPGETKDLSDTEKEKLAEMRARYDAFRAKMHEVKVKPIPK